ncbi:MAG TPA: hypothetical protein DIC36_05815 [Gammaproteobacteria bacterium]|nr:hypothetical protein [Gammaproteobacteria bacterium]
MKHLAIFVVAILTLPIATATLANQSLDEQMLAELRKANPDINHINDRDSKKIDNHYSIFAIYASAIYETTRPHYRLGSVPVKVSPLSGQKIGIFIVDDISKKIIITLDIMQSERGNDFFPHILDVTQSGAKVSFTSDYAVEAMKEYKFDLKTMKLLEAIRLPTPPHPTMCDHGGKIEPCFD